MLKKNLFATVIAPLLIFGGSFSIFLSVQADDDFEQEEREDEEDEEDEEEIRVEKGTEKRSQTIIVEPARLVTENQVRTISLPDRDRDGIVDGEDPHPDIAEIYIVKDENLNGIVDTFESEN